MAIVSRGWKFTVKLVDNGSNTAQRVYDLVAASAAAAATAATAIMAALNAVTDAVITGYTLGEVFQDDADPTLPASGVQVEDQALLILGLTGYTTKTATISIPAPNPGIFVATSGPQANVVDPADAAVLTYVGLFAPTTGVATVSDGEEADGMRAGHRRHIASNSG